MSVFGLELLPTAEDVKVPFWRQCLRGLSECAFQANEVTGLIFVVAVAVYNWKMACMFVIAVIAGTAVARLLRGDQGLLDAGVLGFNAALMGLAMGNFYVDTAALWFAVAIGGAVVGATTVALAKWLPFPFLAAPFIGAFWLLWTLDSHVGLHRIAFSDFTVGPINYFEATVASAGSTLFAPVVWAGALFLIGIAVSNWRHAVVAAGGALLAVALADHLHVAGGAVNSGFVGFNAVLAALVTYIIVAQDLRLAALAALLATWIFSSITRSAPFPALASGFVLSVWAILAVGWINTKFVGSRNASD